MYHIYLIKNKINSKRYVGFTTQTPATRRWNDHQKLSRSGSTFYLHAAIRKYGKENFEFLVLESGDDVKYGHQIREPYFITEYKSHVSSGQGYNLTVGGEGRPGTFHSEETKIKMSLSHKGHTYNRGRKHTKKTRKNMSIAHQGSVHTEEHKQKISDSLKKNSERLKYWLGRKRNFSQVHKENLSKARKDWWAKRKGQP